MVAQQMKIKQEAQNLGSPGLDDNERVDPGQTPGSGSMKPGQTRGFSSRLSSEKGTTATQLVGLMGIMGSEKAASALDDAVRGRKKVETKANEAGAKVKPVSNGNREEKKKKKQSSLTGKGDIAVSVCS
jgi:hypothetical protein